MSYDMHGKWDAQTGLNAPLYPIAGDPTPAFNIDVTVKRWMDAGCAADKLVIGGCQRTPAFDCLYGIAFRCS